MCGVSKLASRHRGAVLTELCPYAAAWSGMLRREVFAQVSQVYWVYLLVSLLSKGDCHVTVTVAESADRESGGTKVKVSSCRLICSLIHGGLPAFTGLSLLARLQL